MFARCWLLLAVVILFPAIHARAHAQCDDRCGTCAPAAPPPNAPVISPRAGRVLPARGKVNALVVFIDFEDETTDTNNANWPRGNGPVGVGPRFMGQFIDQTPEQRSGQKFNITTFYRDQSANQFTIVGYPLYRRAPRTLAAYEADSVTRGNIPYWATREVLTGLTAQDVGGWAQFDSITTDGFYNQSFQPDGKIDFVIVWYRDNYQQRGSFGWRAEGFASLADGPGYTIAGGTLAVNAQALGSGVTCQNGLTYPDCWVPFHETGHYFFGYVEHYAGANGGLWSVMGSRYVNVSYLMNAWSREQLGWITFREAVPGQEADIPDFATTGIAYRMAYPGSEGFLEYYFENHQRLPSPYITSAPDGVFTYDIVDQLNLPAGGEERAKGLYIVESDATNLRVVAADGRWNWRSTGQMANPFSPGFTAQIFERLEPNRVAGITDRRELLGTYAGRPYQQPIWVWRDEDTDAPVWLPTNGRQNGDANDSWKPDVANVFTPWSNPAARFSSSEHLLAGGVQVLAENPDGSVRVKFLSPATALSAPPSRPQDPRAVLGAADTAGRRHPVVAWAPNLEPDVLAGGHYELWRQDSSGGVWANIASVAGGDSSYTDTSITVLAGLPMAERTYRYRLRAADTQAQVSTYSETRVLHIGMPLGKIVPSRAAPLVGGVQARLAGDELVVRTERTGTVTVRLFDGLGREAMRPMERSFTGDGAFTLPLRALPGGRSYCVVYRDGLPAARVPVAVVR